MFPHGFSEKVSYVCGLLELSKKKDVTASFRNMNEQLLSAEGEARNITSLPASHFVSYWLRETKKKNMWLRSHKGPETAQGLSSSSPQVYGGF